MCSDSIYENIINWLNSLYKEIPYISKKLSNYLEFAKLKLKDENLNIDSLKYELKDMIIIDILNSDNYLIFLDFYINKNFTDNMDIMTISNNINEISRLIDNSKRIILIDDCFYLLKNNQVFYKSIEAVYHKYEKFIKENRFHEVNSNSLIKVVMQSFCILNNIEIEDKSFEIDDYYSDDSLAQYINETRKYPVLSKDEEKALMFEINRGSIEAKDLFIKSNLRLVISIVMREFYYVPVPLLDLIQEGNLGLIRAVEKYDVTSGNKFSTYAYNWIESFISRGIVNQSKLIHIPIKFQYKINKYKKVYDSFLEKYNRNPSMQEMVLISGMDEETIKLIESYANGILSYDTAISDDNTSTMLDFIEDSNSDVETNFIKNEVCEIITKLFQSNCLNVNEKKVLIERFGFNGKIKTLEEIGKEIGITRERARQIEEKAKRKAYTFIKKNYSKTMFIPNKNSDDSNSNFNKKRTIYDLLAYPSKQVDYAITLLNEKEQQIIYLKYGPNLNVIYESKISNKENKYFYGVVLPKLKNILKKLYESQPISDFDIIQKETCDKLLNLIRIYPINKLISLYSFNTIVIGFLKIGYVDFIKYNNSAIANFLNMSESDIWEEYKKFKNILKQDELLISVISKRAYYIDLIIKKETTKLK